MIGMIKNSWPKKGTAPAKCGAALKLKKAKSTDYLPLEGFTWGLLPLPGPEGFPVLLGPFGGLLVVFAIK